MSRTSLCPLAFRAGRGVGQQFHPEVDAASVARWAEAAGLDYFEARGLDWFLDQVAGT